VDINSAIYTVLLEDELDKVIKFVVSFNNKAGNDFIKWAVTGYGLIM